MMLVRLAVFAVCAALLALISGSASIAQRPASPSIFYETQFDIVYSDRTLGNPRISMVEGQPVIMSFERANGYSLRSILTRKSFNGRVLANLDLELFVEQGGRWQRVATPQLSLPFGGESSFELQRPGGGQPLLRLGVKVSTPKLATADSAKPSACTPAKYADWEAAMKKPVTMNAALAAPLQSLPC